MAPTTTDPTAPGPGRAAAPDLAELAAAFPQYEIEAVLGRGGMGAVYRARHKKLDRVIAIKVMLPPGDDPEFTARFEREARALAQLEHPGIVRVHDIGETDRWCYFVMEYVDGADLRELIESRQLTPQDALAWIPQICDALQFAHDAGVVHRDIKPENILIDQEGKVRIADFGLAKLIDPNRVSVGLTRSQLAMGTPHYMAPEQLSGAGAVDHRADLYSLGVLLYEMLTGSLPIGRFAPPSAKADSDPRLDDVVMKSLESEPGQRYQQAREVKDDLESMAATEPARRPTPRHSPPRHGKSGVAATDRQEIEMPNLPWGSVITFALVLAASFMSWGTFHGTRDGAIDFLHLPYAIHATAWNGSLFHIPCWLLVFLAAAITILRTLRHRGVRVRHTGPIAMATVGFLYSLIWSLTLSAADAGRTGAGALVTVACMGAWVWIESMEAIHAAEEGRSLRSRRPTR